MIFQIKCKFNDFKDCEKIYCQNIFRILAFSLCLVCSIACNFSAIKGKREPPRQQTVYTERDEWQKSMNVCVLYVLVALHNPIQMRNEFRAHGTAHARMSTAQNLIFCMCMAKCARLILTLTTLEFIVTSGIFVNVFMYFELECMLMYLCILSLGTLYWIQRVASNVISICYFNLPIMDNYLPHCSGSLLQW